MSRAEHQLRPEAGGPDRARRSGGPAGDTDVRSDPVGKAESAQHQVLAHGAHDGRGARAGNRVAHPRGSDREREDAAWPRTTSSSEECSSKSPTRSQPPVRTTPSTVVVPAARHAAPTRAERTQPESASGHGAPTEVVRASRRQVICRWRASRSSTPPRGGPVPASTQVLAALGADAVHVESIQVIDGMRPAAALPFASHRRVVGAELLLPEHQHQQARHHARSWFRTGA